MRLKLVSLLFIGLGTGLFLGAVILLGFNRLDQVQENRPFAPAAGKPATDFELATNEGNKIRLSDLQGRAVMINFWATWCEPCRAEMPMFEEAVRGYPNELVILGVNADESPGLVQAFVEETGVTFPILMDPGSGVSELYRVVAYPTTIFVDPKGIIQSIQLGSMSEQVLAEHLKKIGVAD